MSAVELHGIERQPFPNFREDGTYLEAVTVTEHEEAVDLLRDVLGCAWGGTPQLARVHMRYAAGDEVLEVSGGEYEDGWIECEADHPDALPFWFDGERCPA